MPRFVGKRVQLPLTDRLIPVIADAYVDREFGTGVVKVTPAHDANDYAVGQRHGLPMIGVLDLDARINDNAPAAYRGLDRFVARKKVVADLEALGLLVETQQAPADGAALRTHRPGRRADAHRPVVRRRQQARRRRQEHRRQGGRGGGQRPGALRARAMGQHLQPLDGQPAGLVHQPPALVGPPDPGLVRHGRRTVRGPQRGRGAPARRRRRLPRRTPARRGRARHLVLVGPGAVQHPGLAREDAGAGPVPALDRARHRLRHHLLLGRPDDHDDDPLHRQGAVPRRLHPRSGARRAGPQDEQERRQRARPGGPDRRHRPARAARQAGGRPAPARDRTAGAQGDREGIPAGHSGLRRRRLALHDGQLRHPGPQHQLRQQALRGLPQFLQQALERDQVRADELRGPGLRARGAHQGRLHRARDRRRGPRRHAGRTLPRLPSLQHGRPLDHGRAAARRGRGGAGLRRLPARQRRQRDLRLRVGRVLRLVSGNRQGAARHRRRGGTAGHAPHPDPHARDRAAPAAPAGAVHHRGAVGKRGPGGRAQGQREHRQRTLPAGPAREDRPRGRTVDGAAQERGLPNAGACAAR